MVQSRSGRSVLGIALLIGWCVGFSATSRVAAQIAPIFVWQANQPVLIQNEFLGTLYKVDGKKLLLGTMEFHEDEADQPHQSIPTDEHTVFSIDFERVTIGDLHGGLTIRGNSWLPMRGPPRTFFNEESDSIEGTVLKIEGNKIICPVTIYWIDHNAKIVTFDKNTKVFFWPDVYAPEVPVLKQGSLNDLKAGLEIGAVEGPDAASKIFIIPVVKSDDVSMSHAKSVASLPAREFHSKLSLTVYVASQSGRFSEAGEKLGVTPSAKGISIPAGRMWWVAPAADVPHEEVAAEIERQHIPGLALTDVPAGADLSFLEKLPDLRSIRLMGAGVTDAQLLHCKVMANLEELSLHADQNVTDAGVSQLKGLDELMKLDFSETKLTGVGLKNFDLIPLEDLDLDGSPITDDGVRVLEGCGNIQRVYLAHTEVTDAGMVAFQTLGTMRELDLGGTQVGDVGLENFENLSDLTLLNLQQTKVSSVGMEYLQEMTSLVNLNLAGTRVDDRGLQYIRLMLPLQILDLSGTLVGDGGLPELKELKFLRALNLSSSKVTAGGAAAMTQAFPDCTVGYP